MRRPGSVWFTLHQGGAAIHTDDITNFPEDTDCLIAACLLLAACQSGPAVVPLATPGSPALPCIVIVARRMYRVGRVLGCVFESGSVVIVSCVGLIVSVGRVWGERVAALAPPHIAFTVWRSHTSLVRRCPEGEEGGEEAPTWQPSTPEVRSARLDWHLPCVSCVPCHGLYVPCLP